METSEFKLYFEKVPLLVNHFIGVFPIDKLPVKIKKNNFLWLIWTPVIKKEVIGFVLYD